MSKAMGVGIIGCGNISWAYLKLANLFKDIQVKAVADINMDAAKARAAEFGVRALSVRELLRSPDIDIVVNLTVPATHFDISKQILEAGKHVYSEKPLTLSYKDALALQKLAAKKKLRVCAAPDTFLGSSHQQARKAIDDGDIGKIVSGTCHFMGPGMEMWHPNPDFFFKPGGGPVLDMGPYYITNLINLVGPVKRVSALLGTGRKERVINNQPKNPRNGEKIKVTTPTTYHALLEFVNGACITVSLSWDVWAHKHQNMELYGQSGAMFVPDPNFFGGDVMVAGSDQTPKALKAWDHPFGKNNWGQANSQTDVIWANYRCAGLADMASAIRRKKLPRCDISLVAHVVDVMTAMLDSGKSKKVVTLKSTCKRPAPLGPDEARALMK
ncbi:MAG: Gfo/Idh/MocA family oxidoreductase [Phyllobacteriaceae bacterium]|nr:Gfo/Idh/MocA family oxidoreductase [Phyllobacteriaceae bacterium]